MRTRDQESIPSGEQRTNSADGSGTFVGRLRRRDDLFAGRAREGDATVRRPLRRSEIVPSLLKYQLTQCFLSRNAGLADRV